MGHFIRIRVRFDVDLPLIRRTPVTFPEIGERLIEFKYEYLPEYWFACGTLSHSTQVCVKAYEEVHGRFTIPSLNQFTTTFVGLETDTNLRGKPNGTLARRSPPPLSPLRGSSHLSLSDGPWWRVLAIPTECQEHRGYEEMVDSTSSPSRREKILATVENFSV